jgi:hypothetical protein
VVTDQGRVRAGRGRGGRRPAGVRGGGRPLPDGELLALGETEQSGGKVVTAWALEADFDPALAVPGTFTMEWPKGSGVMREFPEIDRVAWLGLQRAQRRSSRAGGSSSTGWPPCVAADRRDRPPRGSRMRRGGPGRTGPPSVRRPRPYGTHEGGPAPEDRPALCGRSGYFRFRVKLLVTVAPFLILTVATVG